MRDKLLKLLLVQVSTLVARLSRHLIHEVNVMHIGRGAINASRGSLGIAKLLMLLLLLLLLGRDLGILVVELLTVLLTEISLVRWSLMLLLLHVKKLLSARLLGI